MGAFSQLLNEASTSNAQFSIEVITYNIGLSILLGTILAIFTFITNYYSLAKNKRKNAKKRLKVLSGASNILFLCIGLAGVMILVNNNIARAFSIGASLALVRFRVKMDQKNSGSNLLFGVLAGIACGVNERIVAIYIVGIYIVLQLALMLIANILTNFDKEDGSKTVVKIP